MYLYVFVMFHSRFRLWPEAVIQPGGTFHPLNSFESNVQCHLCRTSASQKSIGKGAGLTVTLTKCPCSARCLIAPMSFLRTSTFLWFVTLAVALTFTSALHSFRNVWRATFAHTSWGITWRELYVLSIRNHTHPCLGYGKALKPRGMGPCWNLTATHTPNSRQRKKRWARKNSMSLQKRRGPGFACGRESGGQSSPLKFTTPRLLPKRRNREWSGF